MTSPKKITDLPVANTLTSNDVFIVEKVSNSTFSTTSKIGASAFAAGMMNFGFGYTGSRGFTGSLGFTGSVGYTGSQGIQGYSGSFGYTGSASPESSVVQISNTAHTIALQDSNRILLCSNASANQVLTISNNATIPFQDGIFIEIHQFGINNVVVEPGPGVNIVSSSNTFATTGQYSVIGVRKVGTDLWVITGDLI